jgi:hypothetical protein
MFLVRFFISLFLFILFFKINKGVCVVGGGGVGGGGLLCGVVRPVPGGGARVRSPQPRLRLCRRLPQGRRRSQPGTTRRSQHTHTHALSLSLFDVQVYVSSFPDDWFADMSV